MIKSNCIKITTLVENTGSRQGILAEHGFSILVETDQKTVLLDTGGSPYTVVHNAGVLGVSLSEIDAIILSHGHWDHTGGLAAILAVMNKKVNIIAHPSIWDIKGKSVSPGKFTYIGMQFSRMYIESLGGRFTLAEKPTWITDDIVVSGEEERTTDFEIVESSFAIKKEDGSIVPDLMADDQSLFIKTDKGLVIISGCAHRGIINVIRYAMKVTGEQRVHTVVGGTHLAPAGSAQIKKTIAALKEIGVERVGVSHCTGALPAAILAEEFGDRFFYNNSGTVFNV